MIARRRLGGFAVAVMVGLIAVSRAAPALDRWTTYANPRFGTIADYPADLLTVQDAPPENGDGASFRTADGRAHLSIYGAYNVENDTPQSYVANIDGFEGATYKRVTRTSMPSRGQAAPTSIMSGATSRPTTTIS